MGTEFGGQELSGGQWQQIAILRSLYKNSQILILDEPTAGLDPRGAEEMLNLFISLNKQANITIILVTHDNEIVYNYADDVVLVSSGHIEYSGDALSLFNDKDLMEKHKLLEPKILDLKNRLNNKGFDVPTSVRTIDQLVTYLSKEIR